MKTGTTFLQECLKLRSKRLAADGTLYPLLQRDGVRDLFERRGSLRSPDVSGAWEDLVTAVSSAPQGRVVISQELLSTAGPDRIEHVVAALRPADVHIVLTVRDITKVLPAQWQETIQNRASWSWTDYIGAIVGTREDPVIAKQFEKHDVEGIVRAWAKHVGTNHIHIVTVAAKATSPDELWDRFCSVVGIDSRRHRERPLSSGKNASLSFASAEFLRRLNVALGPEIGRSLYMRHVKHVLGKNAPAHSGEEARPGFEPAQRQWALAHTERLISFLRDSGVHIVGDLGELRPGEPDSHTDGTKPPASHVVDSAVGAVVAMLEHVKKLEERTGDPVKAERKRRRRAARVKSGKSDVRKE